MYKKVNKKIRVLGLILVFLCLSIAPIINADFTKNIIDNIFEKKIIINNSSYDLIIICPKKFTNALKPLIRHKNNFNISTKLVTLKEIYNQISFG